MPIAKDQSDLPKGTAPTVEAHPPDADPWLVEALMTEVTAEFDRPLGHAVPGSRFRFSDADACTRQLAYKWAGVEETNPVTAESLWVMGIGTIIHGYLQRAAERVLEDAEFGETQVSVEHITDGMVLGLDGSGHADLLVTKADGTKVLVEIKTIGGYGYKLAATNFKGPEEGPRTSALIQGALNAASAEADELIVLLVATEALAQNWNTDTPWLRIAAQWTLTREEFAPLAEAEVARINRVSTMFDAGENIPRFLSLDGQKVSITTPKNRLGKGSWVVRGADGEITLAGENAWQCAYCRYQDRCMEEAEFVNPNPTKEN